MGDVMNLVVRKYKKEDFEGASRVLKEAFGYDKEDLTDSRVLEFVACIDDVVVGYFNLMEEMDIIRNIKIYHVGYVCVNSEHRGQRIGRMMMEYAIQYAKEHGVHRMELTSGNKREAAHRLYLSLGFEKRDTSVFRKELV